MCQHCCFQIACLHAVLCCAAVNAQKLLPSNCLLTCSHAAISQQAGVLYLQCQQDMAANVFDKYMCILEALAVCVIACQSTLCYYLLSGAASPQPVVFMQHTMGIYTATESGVVQQRWCYHYSYLLVPELKGASLCASKSTQ